MRALAVLLLVVNVGLITWQYREHIRTLASEYRVQPPPPENAATLKLLAELETLPAPRDRQEAEAPATPVAAEVQADVAPADVCLDVGPFGDAASRDQVRDWLRDYVAASYARRETVRKKQFFWVYMEPSTDPIAQQSLAELKERGITDTLLIRRGEMKNSISLGFFRSQDSVNRRLAELNEKGYKPVVVPRFETSELYWLAVRLGQDTPEVPTIPDALLGASAKQKPMDCADLVTDTVADGPPTQSGPLVEGLTN